MEMAFQLDELEASVRSTLAGGDGEHALRILERENDTLKGRFEADPSMAVTGELFEAAEFLNDQGCALAIYFQERGSAELEEQAWQLRCAPILVAHPYRRNRIGPALLDWGDCNRRMGNIEKADSIYSGVIKDFQEILGWGPSFNSEWLVAVRCLQRALDHTTQEHDDLRSKTDSMLERSERMDNPFVDEEHREPLTDCLGQ